MKRFLFWLAPAALLVAIAGTSQPSALARSSATAPPPPPTLPSATAGAPTPTPIPGLTGAQPKTTPSPSPPPANEAGRVGLSGVWEIQIQRESDTAYAHFKLAQKSGVLSGIYMDPAGKQFPLAGSIDVKTVHLVISMPDGSTLTFEGTQDNNMDMLGMMTSAKESIAFTAAYRPKEKFIDNISPGAGGLGGLGGGRGPTR